MKKFISLALALSFVISFSACNLVNDPEDYISGTSFEIPVYETETFTRYANKLHGIVIEYPEKFVRMGNFDLDGYISFEDQAAGIAVKTYTPDTENQDMLNAEEYSQKILKFANAPENMNTRYGKSNGYKAVSRDGGNITIDFVVKGVDGFYRFSYTCPEKDFPENQAQFEAVMSSIRIDDGVYNKLARMANRYKVLLEYVISMQYVTDANYANHCLNSFELSNEEIHKNEAIKTYNTIKEEIRSVAEHTREEGEGYDDYWQKIVVAAREMLTVCERAIDAIEKGDTEEAQRIARTAFSYELSENASKFLATINAEIDEY